MFRKTKQTSINNCLWKISFGMKQGPTLMKLYFPNHQQCHWKIWFVSSSTKWWSILLKIIIQCTYSYWETVSVSSGVCCPCLQSLCIETQLYFPLYSQWHMTYQLMYIYLCIAKCFRVWVLNEAQIMEHWLLKGSAVGQCQEWSVKAGHEFIKWLRFFLPLHVL